MAAVPNQDQTNTVIDQVLSKLPMGLGYQPSMDLLKKNRPKYKISDTYDENIAIARQQAFGPDRAISEQQKGIDESIASGTNQARQFSGSTSALLETLSNLYSNKNKALRGLAADQSALQSQKLASLMGANVMKAEEQDKEWNFNVNEPYQLRVKEVVDRKKRADEAGIQLSDILGLAASFIPGGGLANLFKGKPSSGASNVASGYGENFNPDFQEGV